MAKSKDDIKYATAQARLNEDEAVRVAYKHGTPLEGGKIGDSEPVDLFSGAHNIQKARDFDQDHNEEEDPTTQPQLHPHPATADDEQGGGESNTKSDKFPSKKPPSLATK